MSGARRVGAVVLGVVSLVVVAAAWLRAPDPISADDAAALASEALAAAGVDAEVGPQPSAGSYEPESGDPIPVWQTVASAADGTVILWLAQDGGEPVFLDDRGPSGATQLLTEEQFQALAAHQPTLTRDRLLREDLAITAAAALVLAVAVAHASARR